MKAAERFFALMLLVASIMFAGVAAEAVVGVGGVNGIQGGPVRLYLLYPNYRGYLFDDWSQTVSVDVSVRAPGGFSLSQLQVKLSLLDSANAPAASRTLSAAADFTATLDASTLADGTYQLQAQLLSGAAELANPPPAYTIVKAPASTRASMKAYLDPNNLLHYGGQAVFPVGVYDLPNPSALAHRATGSPTSTSFVSLSSPPTYQSPLPTAESLTSVSRAMPLTATAWSTSPPSPQLTRATASSPMIWPPVWA